MYTYEADAWLSANADEPSLTPTELKSKSPSSPPASPFEASLEASPSPEPDEVVLPLSELEHEVVLPLADTSDEE